MNPPVPDELISAYFDGEVTPEERGQVEQLLENSAELRQFLDDTSKLSALLHSFPRAATPGDLATNVQQRINAIKVAATPRVQTARRSLRREIVAFATGIIATAASLVAVYVSINHSPQVGEPFGMELGQKLRFKHPSGPLKQESEGMEPSKVASLESQVAPGHDRSSKMAEDMDHPEVAQAASNSPLPPELGLRDLDAQMNADSNSLLLNGSRIEPGPPEEFVKQLKRGDVWYNLSLDPANTVMVVEFTVVDVDKGAEGMELVLSKRHVPSVESEELLKRNESLRESPREQYSSRRKRSTRDDLVVCFVRAPARELASTIQDLIEDSKHFNKLKLQAPIPLPAGGIANTGNTVGNDAKMDAVAFDNSSNNANGVVEQPVAVEATLAANFYATTNGLKINESESSGEKREKEQLATSPATASSKDQIASEDSKAAARSVAGRSDGSKSNSIINNAGANATQGTVPASLGYSLFHVAPDKSSQQRQLNMQSNETRGFPYQVSGNGNAANQIGNGNPFGNTAQFSNLGQMNNSGMAPQQFSRNFRQQLSRANSESRDAQLMRMLIVLKTAQPAADKPAP